MKLDEHTAKGRGRIFCQEEFMHPDFLMAEVNAVVHKAMIAATGFGKIGSLIALDIEGLLSAGVPF